MNDACEDCNIQPFVWADDDGVLRCDGCHNVVAGAWGGDYNVLVAR